MPATPTDRIDGLTTSVAVKAPCKTATTANITLSGLQTVGGVALVSGDRVLVKDQTDGTQNGIYVANTSAWSRSRDFDGTRDVVQGTVVLVATGTSETAAYRVTTADTIVIGTSSIQFALALFSDSATVNFLQAGTGAVTRTALSKMREAVSPEDFGAVGDGVTNDAAAFATAIAALATNGSLILKSGSTYLIGSAGVLFSGKTGILLDGRGAIIKLSAVSNLLNAVGSPASIKFLNCTRCSIVDVEINGNSKATDAVTFTTCTDCTMERVTAYSCGGTAILTSFGSVRTRVTGCLVYSSVGQARGIWMGNHASGQEETDLGIIRNISRNNGFTGIVFASIGGRCEGNHSKANAGSGIIVGGTGGFGDRRVAIVGNYCEGNSFHGIQSDTTAYATDADVAQDIIVSGNECYANTHAGIFAQPSIRWAISNNICTDNVDAGIYVARFTRVSVVGNVCCDSRAGGSRTQQNGIVLLAETLFNVSEAVVSGNVCSNNTSDGLRILTTTTETVDAINVVANQCRANGSHGMNIQEATTGAMTNLSVVGNVATGNTGTDAIVGPLDVAIADNLFSTESGMDYWTFPDNAATPSVKGARRLFRCTHSVATNVTNFTDGTQGQVIDIYFGTANATLKNGASLGLKGAVDTTPAAGTFLRFFNTGSAWLEMSRSY